MDEYDEEYEAEVMSGSVDDLANSVVGHRITGVTRGPHPDGPAYGRGDSIRITLDNGTAVYVADTDDCCAFTEVEDFKFLEDVDNAVTRVVAEGDFTRWFIYAGNAPVLELDVAWSPGNPYYYGFGFQILVKEDA